MLEELDIQTIIVSPAASDAIRNIILTSASWKAMLCEFLFLAVDAVE